MSQLNGKVALITGGTSGLGLATAMRFVSEGAHVFITGRRQTELDAAVKLLGSQATGVQGDVSKLADLDNLLQSLSERRDTSTSFLQMRVAERFCRWRRSPRNISTRHSTLT